MAEAPPGPGPKPPEQQLRDEVARRVARRRRAEREAHHSIWSSLGLFGIVGWSVAVPALLGVAAGLWLDAHHPARFSWTLSLLALGTALGCVNAWYWVRQESREDVREQEHEHGS